MEWQKQVSLKILLAGEPVLRQKAKELSKEEILSPSIQELIKMMRITLRAAPGVGLAAPQVGIPLQLAVIEDPEDYQKMFKPEQLAERGRVPVPFHVIINPKIYPEGKEQADFFEACLSTGGCAGLVSRYLNVKVECLNEKAEPVVIKAKGWYARILQHEIDHFHGILNVDKMDIRTFSTIDNFNRLWKDKSVDEARQSLIT